MELQPIQQVQHSIVIALRSITTPPPSPAAAAAAEPKLLVDLVRGKLLLLHLVLVFFLISLEKEGNPSHEPILTRTARLLSSLGLEATALYIMKATETSSRHNPLVYRQLYIRWSSCGVARNASLSLSLSSMIILLLLVVVISSSSSSSSGT